MEEEDPNKEDDHKEEEGVNNNGGASFQGNNESSHKAKDMDISQFLNFLKHLQQAMERGRRWKNL